MSRTLHVICVFLFMSVSSLCAQGEPPDPIEVNTFSPELVMQNQQAIGLSENQRSFIKKEVLAAQTRFTDLQWDLESQMEKFISLISQDKIDEKLALDTLEKILSLESQIKRANLTLAIRIKNMLTPEQQELLREVRELP